MLRSSGSPAFFREKPTAPEDFRPSFRLELQKNKYRVPRETPRTTIGRRENSHVTDVTPYKLGGEALGFLQQEKKERSGKKKQPWQWKIHQFDGFPATSLAVWEFPKARRWAYPQGSLRRPQVWAVPSPSDHPAAGLPRRRASHPHSWSIGKEHMENHRKITCPQQLHKDPGRSG